ncbi:NAD(P)H-dependent oxidoreductase [Candidatus Gracilibacteria bacterium]|nr:NAD(P)H-dependent oxidoreductase [Candidatus Gracilibacteria bacterium]NUJ98432.1 NAD(P)H-dependent oxidoreductase [Candidatus Gracilibacteria bacterium]
MQDIIQSLNWRCAVKRFDTNKKISDSDIETIKEILRLTPSAYGVQPWKFLIIKNKELRKKLREVSKSKAQVEESDIFIVFCSLRTLDEKYINKHLFNVSQTREIERATLDPYKEIILQSISSLPPQEYKAWAEKQVYIALGNLLTSLACMKIDACPLEAINKERYDEILGLKEKNLSSSVACAIGYRSKEDTYSLLKKVRFDTEELFEIIN